MSSYTYQTIFEAIGNFKSNRDTDLSAKTISEYKKKFTRINEIEPEIINKLIEAQSDKKIVNSIINKVKGSFKNSKDYFSVISKIINSVEGLKLQISPYIKSRVNQVVKEEVVKNVEDVDERVQFEPVKIQWLDYVRFVDKISKDETVPLKVRIMFSLYKEYTLRDDFGNVLIVSSDPTRQASLSREDDDNNINYYNKSTRVLHLNRYKTIEKFGRKKYKIPTYIADMIDESNSKYIIGVSPTKTYAGGNLSTPFKAAMKKYYGSIISINDLRHSIISFYNDTKSIKKQKQLAEIMLHSYHTQSDVYKRRS